MKPSTSSAPKVPSKLAQQTPHKDAAAAVVMEEPPKLKSQRPTRPRPSSTFGTRFDDVEVSTPTSAGGHPETAAATVAKAGGGRHASQTKQPPPPPPPPPRKAHGTPHADGERGVYGSSSSSMTTDKTGQPSVPPALPLHRPLTSNDGGLNNSQGSDAGIVESSRSYLTRLSLEDAVVALERLRFLMMSHTAAVAGSQADHGATPVAVEPPQLMHVDPFKLSKRPLEDIADELCSQLRRLTVAYSAASAADRSLLGVREARRPTQSPSSAAEGGARVQVETAPLGGQPMNGNDDNLLGTFGPMVSTQHMVTVHGTADSAAFLDSHRSIATEDSWGGIDLHKPNPGPRSAYPNREDSDGYGDLGSTTYKYPNGMVVSFPLSTFGELVSTESGHGTTVRSRLGGERHPTVSSGTQTDDALEPTKKEKELQAYVKALESRLTEKQCLEAMKESRGARKSSMSANLTKLAQKTESAAKPEKASSAQK